jgi:DNA-binding CsgD family transcriptional regulator
MRRSQAHLLLPNSQPGCAFAPAGSPCRNCTRAAFFSIETHESLIGIQTAGRETMNPQSNTPCAGPPRSHLSPHSSIVASESVQGSAGSTQLSSGRSQLRAAKHTATPATKPPVLLCEASGRVLDANGEALDHLLGPGVLGEAPSVDHLLLPPDLAAAVQGSLRERVIEVRLRGRCYSCRVFQLLGVGSAGGRVVVILEASAQRDCLANLLRQFHLTAREEEAVELLARGLTNKEIATSMRVSVNTVKTFLHLAMIKLGVSTRAGIIGKLVPQSG